MHIRKWNSGQALGQAGARCIVGIAELTDCAACAVIPAMIPAMISVMHFLMVWLCASLLFVSQCASIHEAIREFWDISRSCAHLRISPHFPFFLVLVSFPHGWIAGRRPVIGGMCMHRGTQRIQAADNSPWGMVWVSF